VKKLFRPICIGIGGSLLVMANAQAQQTDNTQTLPDAKPGECYAKVVTPAKFATRTEEVVVQEATERVTTIPAKFEVAEQTVVVEEASRRITVVPAVYGEEFEKIEVRPAESSWQCYAGKPWRIGRHCPIWNRAREH